jgi:uncharacterized protein YqkB
MKTFKFINTLRFTYEDGTFQDEFATSIQEAFDRLFQELDLCFLSERQIYELKKSDRFERCYDEVNMSGINLAQSYIREAQNPITVTELTQEQQDYCEITANGILRVFRSSQEYIDLPVDPESLYYLDQFLVQFFKTVWTISFTDKYNTLAIKSNRNKLLKQFKGL